VGDYRLSPRAKQDLQEIWRYTERTWSDQQAEKYANLLIDMIERLAETPETGKRADEIRPGYWKQRVGSHLIFYRTTGAGIEVVRILHARMDIEGRLRSDD
jgi:toxin ParE1/3/4